MKNKSLVCQAAILSVLCSCSSVQAQEQSSSPEQSADHHKRSKPNEAAQPNGAPGQSVGNAGAFAMPGMSDGGAGFQPGFRNGGQGGFGAPGGGIRAQGGQGGPTGGAGGKSVVRSMIQEQRQTIMEGVQNGTISPEKAKQLQQNLSNVVQQVRQERQAAGGGPLSQEQKVQALNALKQNQALLNGAPTDNGNLGPKWAPGPDGAQNPNQLQSEMKREERRELRQERQANLQTQEQQQLDYEKQMMDKFGDQRKSILQGKREVDQARKNNGANN